MVSLKQITKRAELSAKLLTLINLVNDLEDKITDTEKEIVKLDMEITKDGLERKENQLDQ